MSYEITLDREACDGIFACLVRDDRFREAEDGLVTVAPDAAGVLAHEESAERVTVTVDDDRRGDAEQAAAACPVDAISVADATAEADR